MMKLSKLLTAGPLSGGVTPTGFNFDQGSYATFAEVSADVYRITPRAHWDSKWAWWALRSGKFAGKTPHFLIAKAAHFNMVSGEWLACWATAADTDTWYLFDNVTIGATDLEFYHNTAFPGGTVYIAAMPMYPFSRTQRMVSEWGASSLAGETDSTTNYILGNATARDNGDARGTIPALPYYGMRFANATANTKNSVVLASGNHPSENIGRFMLEGAVNWALTTGYKQKTLMDWCELYVYPCLNPQGVYGGWFRSSPETPTEDNNRLWNTTGTNEAVDAFKAAWTADVSDTIGVGFDYHSWMSNDGNKGITGDSTTALWVAYIAAVQALDATYTQRTDDTTASMIFNYWRSLTTQMAGAPDHGGVTTLGPTEWKQAGARTMEAVADMLAAGRFTNNPGVGSRDFNGTTDRIDFPNAYNPTGHATTISAWIYTEGVADTNSDYILNIQNASDAAYGLVFYARDSSAGSCRQLGFTANGATDILRLGSVFANFANSWHHALVTWDGVFNNATGIHLYLDGVEASGYDVTTNGATQDTHTGSYCLGGRTADDARNWNGKLAQVGVWNTVLTAGNIANLAAGQSPDTISSGLQFYWKGNTSSLTASPGGDGTADGTTQLTGAGTGPAIYYA
jgi:hypothetical protein